MSENTHVYIGSLSCGCHVAAIVDTVDDKKRTANDVQRFITDGYTVSRHSLDDMRNGTIKLAQCTHKT